MMDCTTLQGLIPQSIAQLSFCTISQKGQKDQR